MYRKCGKFDWLLAKIGWKMANGQLLFCALIAMMNSSAITRNSKAIAPNSIARAYDSIAKATN